MSILVQTDNTTVSSYPGASCTILQYGSFLVTATYKGDVNNVVDDKSDIYLEGASAGDRDFLTIKAVSTADTTSNVGSVSKTFRVTSSKVGAVKVIFTPFVGGRRLSGGSVLQDTYTSISWDDLDFEVAIPSLGDVKAIVDSTPSSDNPPDATHQYATLSLSLKKSSDGAPLKQCQYPLTVGNGNWCRFIDYTTPTKEYSPDPDYAILEGEQLFHFNLGDNGVMLLRLYPASGLDVFIKKITLDLDIKKINIPGSSVLMITDLDDEPGDLDHPMLVEAGNGVDLSPSNTDVGFHVQIPLPSGGETGYDAYIFNEYKGKDPAVQNKHTFVAYKKIATTKDYNHNIDAKYVNIPAIGGNILYYYLVGSADNHTRSEGRFYNLTVKPGNHPSEDVTRNEIMPGVILGSGNLATEGPNGSIGYDTIQEGNLTIRVPLKSDGSDKDFPAVGDLVSVNVYINAYNIDGSAKTGNPAITSKQVKSSDVNTGYLDFPLQSSNLTGYDSDKTDVPGWIEIEYYVDENYSEIWYSKINTVPPGSK